MDGAHRKGHALAERLCTPTTSQRETMSMAVKCLRITPGSGRTSRVSTWTRSPGPFDGVALGFVAGVRALGAALAGGDEPVHRLVQESPAPGSVEDPAYCGRRDLNAVGTQKATSACACGHAAGAGASPRPPRTTPGRIQVVCYAWACGCGLPGSVGCAGCSGPPAVERLPADAEMPAGQRDVVPVNVAELEPLQSQPGCFG